MDKRLEMPQLDPELSGLLNGIFYRSGPVTLSGRDLSFGVRFVASARPFKPAMTVTLDSEGVQLAVHLEHALFADRLAGAGHLGDSPLDDALRPALYEVLFEGLLNRFQDLTGAAVRVASVEFFENETERPDPADGLAFELTTDSFESPVAGTIAYSTEGLALIAKAVAFAPASQGPDFSYVPVTARAEVGTMSLTLAVAGELTVDDVLLPDAFWLADNQAYLRVSPQLAYHCAVQGNLLVVQDIVMEGAMQEMDERVDAPEQAQETAPEQNQAPADEAVQGQPDLSGLELTVVFELGEKRLTLEEINQIRPGMTFDLGKGLAEPVTIRVNGTAVGMGEPVQLGDRVGVRITKLS